MRDRLDRLAQRARRAIEGDILPFWLRLEDRDHGGHFGAMDNAGRIDRAAPKSTIFVARLLWTLSTVHRVLGVPEARAQADRTRRFLVDRLADPDAGGLWWSATADGRPLETDKHVYAQAFAIYGLAAHGRATGNAGSLETARRLFALVEERARDPRTGSYGEAFDAAWQPVENRRMAAGGRVGARTSNTHLHLIEAYAGLLEARPDPVVRSALKALLGVFVDRFLAADGGHSHALLDAALSPLPGPVSWGHDIEASWLMAAAARTVGDEGLEARVGAAATALARSAAAAGQAPDGAWMYERRADGAIDSHRVWWVQAEAVVGLVDAALRTGDATLMTRAERCWDFIERAMMDRDGGEWFWRVDAAGRPDHAMPKVSAWKEPYHQARACLELIGRAGWR
jgi:mannobiose 2-epimerase